MFNKDINKLLERIAIALETIANIEHQEPTEFRMLDPLEMAKEASEEEQYRIANQLIQDNLQQEKLATIFHGDGYLYEDDNPLSQ